MFRFKQFTIHDDKCGMKVGTDGTLLGAWVGIPDECHRILDIGTGSGLLALMLAQRSAAAEIIGIDIDADAISQAADNFHAAPWPARLHAQQASLQDYPTEAFDLIVSNPPYFIDSLKNPDAARQAARHTDTLSYPALVAHSARLTREGGIIAYVLPAEAEKSILSLAADHGLTPLHITRVHTKAGKAAKRVLLSFIKGPSAQPLLIDSLCLIGDDGQPRSPEYQALCSDFYL